MQNMRPSFFRRNKFLDPVRKEDHTNLIVVLNSRECQHSRNLGNLILFQFRHRTEITRGTHVNQQHHGQLTLFLEYFHVRVIITSCHVPVNTSNVIPVLISPHLAKRHSPTFKSRVILPCKDITR